MPKVKDESLVISTLEDLHKFVFTVQAEVEGTLIFWQAKNYEIGRSILKEIVSFTELDQNDLAEFLDQNPRTLFRRRGKLSKLQGDKVLEIAKAYDQGKRLVSGAR